MAETIKAYEAAPYSYPEARTLVEELGLSDPVAVTLVRRGYRTPAAARAFLEADESHPPLAFPSMGEVVARLLGAIEAGGRITVHGDFDVDGVCATVIMVSALRELGAECDWLIPDRLADGYGLGAANIELLARRGTSLLLTVDCGITAVEEVRLAQQLGMEVIVTDHHQPPDSLPDCPIVHPGLGGYPFAELCGSAVAWKLACAMRDARGGARADRGEDDLDLVALATVADVVPLVGENRSLVRRGLAVMRRAQRIGLRALIAEAGVEPSRLDEGDLGFRLAPRINAAGRLYRADAGVELFLSTDEVRAAEIAAELSRANGERRGAEREVATAAEAARRELPEELREAPGLVLAGRDWHPGVVGIVASRLVERHYRPVVVLSLDAEGGARGSGRSIPGFDLLGALEACSSHLVRFGGHRAAAGLELRAASVEAFRVAFAAHAAEVLDPDQLRRTERIDAMVGGAGLGLGLAEELNRLGPFGIGNPGVRLLVPSARVSDVRTMGEGKHSRFSLHSGSHRALGVAFGRSSLGVGEDQPVDAAVRLELNHWNGSVEPRVVLRELFPQSSKPLEVGAEGSRPWWERFGAELEADPAEAFAALPAPSAGDLRTEVQSAQSPAAVVAELVSSGESVLALVADAGARVALGRRGLTLADYLDLQRRPALPQDFSHVVLVDPPPFAHLRQSVAAAAKGGGYLHPVWGDAERRFAMLALAAQCAQRDTVAALFRALREAGEVDGESLRRALVGAAMPRSATVAARCFRVLRELELVEGEAGAGGGLVWVVSSEGTDLGRSAAFRAYSARFKEGTRYLEGHKHP